jgi:hypothetical protein
MDMKKHMLIYFSYPSWWAGKKSEVIIKMEVVIKKKIEIVRLEMR